MANPLGNEFLAGLTDALDYDHFMLATYVTNEDLEKYRKTIVYISQQRPSGVVVWVQAKEYCDVPWDCLSTANIPVVGLGPHSIPNISCDYVRDYVADAGTLVGRYIARRNFRDIAFLCTTSYKIQGERIEAIRRELGKAGIRLPDEKIFFVDAPHGYMLPPDPYLDAREFMTKLLRDGFHCECLVCGHDYPAVGVLQAILKQGIKIPEEMKVISCGRSGVEGVSPMKLTTCFVDFSEQGRKAVQVLMRRINGFTGPPEIHYTPVTLIEGETA
jgi:DNA-binding LacI/PurR family transcriptional regulator